MQKILKMPKIFGKKSYILGEKVVANRKHTIRCKKISDAHKFLYSIFMGLKESKKHIEKNYTKITYFCFATFFTRTKIKITKKFLF